MATGNTGQREDGIRSHTHVLIHRFDSTIHLPPAAEVQLYPGETLALCSLYNLSEWFRFQVILKIKDSEDSLKSQRRTPSVLKNKQQQQKKPSYTTLSQLFLVIFEWMLMNTSSCLLKKKQQKHGVCSSFWPWVMTLFHAITNCLIFSRVAQFSPNLHREQSHTESVISVQSISQENKTYRWVGTLTLIVTNIKDGICVSQVSF